MDSWAQAGAVKQWHGPVGTLHAAGAGPASKFTPFAPEAPARWVGTKGMRMLAKALEEDLVKQHPNLVEVSMRVFAVALTGGVYVWSSWHCCVSLRMCTHKQGCCRCGHPQPQPLR